MILFIFKIIFTVYYIFILIFAARPFPHIFSKYLENNFFNFLRFFNLTMEWGVFTKVKGNGFDLKITATTRRGKYLWYLAKEKTIGNFTIESASSRLLLSHLYNKLGKAFLNYFYTNHLRRFFKNRNDELLELEIQLVLIETQYEDFSIPYNRNSHERVVMDACYIWKKK